MKRIGVMTFLHNDNYGSILQAWALQQVLTDLGYETEHIDYAPSRQEKIRNLLMSGNSPRLILEGMRKRSAAGKMHGGFDGFRSRYIATSMPCHDHKALIRQADRYDVLVCGSDQIWSPVWLNPAYFLDFASGPKVAYAPSLGVKELPSLRKQKRMARLVKRFNAVSVREQEGAALISRMTGRAPDVLPDPVILLPKERWQCIMDIRLPQEKYLLCYFIGDHPDYWRHVGAVASREGLAVRVIPRTEGARQSGYTLEEDVPPERWLALLNGAAHVVTDSFHGASFSAILNRSCTILRRYREEDPESKNSRIDQLLRNLGVESLEAPEWTQVNARLGELAAQGRSWLKGAVSQAAQEAAAAGKT
ncbi:MAG: polysaccharide pyruvyl transferase family protein [Clostridia bacterium]|nr:polysaccharide pyruvyl transferase family protein [Clostridia bacterium]